MLTKYWSAFLLAALVITSLFDRRRDDYWRSRAPWITAIIFFLAVLPHAVWLVDEQFPPLQWIASGRESHSISEFLGSLAEYSGGTVGYAGIALLLALVLFRPSVKAMCDSWLATEPVRRPATLLFWLPLLLPIVVAIFTKTNLLSLWNEPDLNLLPVMMLASPLVAVSRAAVVRLAAIVTAITLICVAASPIVALSILKVGVENFFSTTKSNAPYVRLLAAAVDRQWRESSTTPLRIVAGPFSLASPAAFYIADKPVPYSDFSNYLSPWVSTAELARDGVAIICPVGDQGCLDHMNDLTAAGPAGKRSEVTLTRHWLGFASKPKSFVIATVPPRS
jgi:4-amino-4-deoxy-L-arabinose transferase-like glycosyltransferase